MMNEALVLIVVCMLCGQPSVSVRVPWSRLSPTYSSMRPRRVDYLGAVGGRTYDSKRWCKMDANVSPFSVGLKDDENGRLHLDRPGSSSAASGSWWILDLPTKVHRTWSAIRSSRGTVVLNPYNVSRDGSSVYSDAQTSAHRVPQTTITPLPAAVNVKFRKPLQVLGARVVLGVDYLTRGLSRVRYDLKVEDAYFGGQFTIRGRELRWSKAWDVNTPLAAIDVALSGSNGGSAASAGAIGDMIWSAVTSGRNTFGISATDSRQESYWNRLLHPASLFPPATGISVISSSSSGLDDAVSTPSADGPHRHPVSDHMSLPLEGLRFKLRLALDTESGRLDCSLRCRHKLFSVLQRSRDNSFDNPVFNRGSSDVNSQEPLSAQTKIIGYASNPWVFRHGSFWSKPDSQTFWCARFLPRWARSLPINVEYKWLVTRTRWLSEAFRGCPPSSTNSSSKEQCLYTPSVPASMMPTGRPLSRTTKEPVNAALCIPSLLALAGLQGTDALQVELDELSIGVNL